MSDSQCGKCATCRHWLTGDEGWHQCADGLASATGEAVAIGSCAKLPMFWNATRWAEDGEGRELLTEHQDTLAFLQDGSDYVAGLLTRGEFGCANHETLPTVPSPVENG